MARRNIISTDISQGLDMRSASPDPTTGRFSQALANRAAQNFNKFSSSQKIPSSSKFNRIDIQGDSNLSPPATLSPSNTLTLQQNLPASPKPKPKPQARRTRKKKYETVICPPGCVPESRVAGKTKKYKKKKKKNKRKTKRHSKKRIRGGSSIIPSAMLLGLYGGRKYNKY
jgi:hypothetical protein